MQQATVLDLGTDRRNANSPRRTLPNVLIRLVWGLLLTLVLGGAMLAAGGFLSGRFSGLFDRGEPVIRLSFEDIRRVEAMTVDDKSQIVVEGVAAEERNAAIPLTTMPLEHVGQFLLGSSSKSNFANALKCLTQAVYYEAANEPMQGRQAVAQVILNRMRHPAYPKSVCGVVYQGSERRTGCQFSFTCDGSLLRAPMAGRWREAEAVALAALGGFVETSAGTATHYHADYVLPKWAFQLAKIEQLGRHIFYRFPGQWGRALAFNGRYNQAEHLPSIDYAALRLRAEQNGAFLPAVADPQLVPGLTVEPSISDRHAPTDVGGRLDMTKTWRLNIPDPTDASTRYRAVAGVASEGKKETEAKGAMAAAVPGQAVVHP